MSDPAETAGDRFLHRLSNLLQRNWRSLVLFIPFFWLLLFFLAPFFIVLKISLAETIIASPPFTPMIEWVDEGIMHIRVVVDNFAYLWEDDLYAKTYLNSLKISSISTILCLLVGYPMAYAIVRLPLYANMEKLDWTLLEAAADLGAKPMTTFFTVTLPMTLPGIIAGSLLVFIPATGEYVIPDLLGGGNVLMIGRILYNEFNANIDWPVASAVAIALLLLLVLPMMLYQHMQAKQTEAE
jgi:ABC-type spermidine/putrescine transport system permease subunit I